MSKKIKCELDTELLVVKIENVKNEVQDSDWNKQDIQDSYSYIKVSSLGCSIYYMKITFSK